MLKRTLFFSNPASLSLKNNQLVISREKNEGNPTVPIEDIGFVVVENMQVIMTMPLLEQLTANNAAVIFCNSKHHPNSMLLNLDGNQLQTEVFRTQIEASEPIKKNLWKQTIEAKIKNQAGLLKKLGKDNKDIETLAGNVKSGDIDNREGTAARLYWPRLFGKTFRRERFGMPPNNLLNYGYIILRAAVARALTGSGLLPTLGIHHHNRYNAFCLADDIMEPYRPYVDGCVYELTGYYDPEQELDKNIKMRLLEILSSDVHYKDFTRPLMVGLSITTASLACCYSGEQKKISYPMIN